MQLQQYYHRCHRSRLRSPHLWHHQLARLQHQRLAVAARSSSAPTTRAAIWLSRAANTLLGISANTQVRVRHLCSSTSTQSPDNALNTGEKPFACRCGKSFTRLDNLRQHASTIHADEPEANEELFTRLAAHMPRSGQRARRQAAQKKPPSPPDLTGITSPSVLQGSFVNVPPMPKPAPSARTPAYGTATEASSSYSYQAGPSSLPPSPFRFPPSPNAPPGTTFRTSAYQGYSTHTSTHSWSSGQQHVPAQSPTHQVPAQSPIHQHTASFHSPSPRLFNTNNPISPVPVLGGGSHFRNYPSSTSFPEPAARVKSTRTIDWHTSFPGRIPATATSPVSATSSEPYVFIADTPTRPVLPCKLIYTATRPTVQLTCLASPLVVDRRWPFFGHRPCRAALLFASS